VPVKGAGCGGDLQQMMDMSFADTPNNVCFFKT